MAHRFVSDGYPEAVDFDDNYQPVAAPARAPAAERAFRSVPLPRRGYFSLFPRLTSRAAEADRMASPSSRSSSTP